MKHAAPISDLPSGYHARFATLNDLPAATALSNLCEMADSGVADLSEEEMRSEWEAMQLGRDVVLILIDDGQLAGSIQIEPYSGGSYVASGYVHPDHTGRGLGTALVRWSEHRVQSDLTAGDSEGRSLVHAINDASRTAGPLFIGCGYELEKKFIRMRIDLAEEPALPVLPAGFRIDPIVGDPDLEGFYAVVEESFRDHWSIAPRTFDNWKESALGQGYDPNHWSQVFDGDSRVGIAIGLNDFGEGWIRWVGVREKYRRLGLGQALMLDQFRRYWNAGITRIGLGYDQTNLSDPGRLYERVGMRPAMVTALYQKTITAHSAS